jgi:hypothetical protein
MIAGVIRAFGFDLGRELSVNNEDPDFSYRTTEQMILSIKERDKRHARWGWKFPMASVYLQDIVPHVRNPLLIIVARDVVATAIGLTRWDGRTKDAAVAEVIETTQKNVSLAVQVGVPTLLVSYEKAVLKPSVFIDEMAQFLRVDLMVDRARLVRFMLPGNYKSYEETVLEEDESPPES